jgi:hypothetical protein
MIHLQVVVPDTAELLALEAYDAGALLRWESSAEIDGIYVEGGTIALVADVSLYDIWDAAGVEGTTWYRRRLSDAGGTTFSAYSDPFQTSIHDLYLSTDQFRLLEPTTLPDEALQILLDAAAQDIVDEAGPSGEITERRRASGELVVLSRRALSITSVVEGTVTLDPDDYELSLSRSMLRRLRTGPNPSRRWFHPLITYLVVDDLASRQRVQRELVRLAIAFQPGLASQTIGTWSEAYATGQGSKTYDEQRAEILASLSDPVGVM